VLLARLDRLFDDFKWLRMNREGGSSCVEFDSTLLVRGIKGQKYFMEAFLLTSYLYNELNRHTEIFQRSGNDESGSCNSFPLSF
jgi:hypothetical protein